MRALHWDLAAWQREVKRKHETDPKTTQQSSFHFRWIMGTEDIDTAIERAGRFSLAGVAQKIACPFLIYREKNPASIFIDAGFGAGLLLQRAQEIENVLLLGLLEAVEL